MKTNRSLLIRLTAAVLLGSVSIASIAQASVADLKSATTLVEEVRTATARYKDVAAAEAAGYALFHGCVNGPEQGAMGVHFVNGNLVGDGAIDATQPEALIYEWKNGRYQIVGVEYVVIADAWNAAHNTPPVLKGQLFTYTGSPNRYGIPAFYALHVWAWRDNPNGTFADWNSRVSCTQFTGETATHADH